MSATHDEDVCPRRKGHHQAQWPGCAGEYREDEKAFVGVTEFDYDAVDGVEDRGNPLAGFDDDEREMFTIFGSLWAEVLEWVYLPKNTRMVGMRFKAVIYCCRPQMLGEDCTLKKIAEKEGCKKQTFQVLTAMFRDQFKTVCRSMRKEISREHMKRAALKIHAKKKAAREKIQPQ